MNIERRDKMNTGNSERKEELPIGFAMGMAMNEEARNRYSNMSEERRKKVEENSRQVTSKYEMQELLRDVADGKF